MTWDKIVKLLAGIAGGIAGLFGGWDLMLQVLLIFMVVDYVTGWIVAILGNSVKTKTGHLDSRISWKGILKKGLALAVVLLGAMLDKAIGQQAAFRRVRSSDCVSRQRSFRRCAGGCVRSGDFARQRYSESSFRELLHRAG